MWSFHLSFETLALSKNRIIITQWIIIITLHANNPKGIVGMFTLRISQVRYNNQHIFSFFTNRRAPNEQQSIITIYASLLLVLYSNVVSCQKVAGHKVMILGTIEHKFEV